jgi:hypothetical protein
MSSPGCQASPDRANGDREARHRLPSGRRRTLDLRRALSGAGGVPIAAGCTDLSNGGPGPFSGRVSRETWLDQGSVTDARAPESMTADDRSRNSAIPERRVRNAGRAAGDPAVDRALVDLPGARSEELGNLDPQGCVSLPRADRTGWSMAVAIGAAICVTDCVARPWSAPSRSSASEIVARAASPARAARRSVTSGDACASRGRAGRRPGVAMAARRACVAQKRTV